MTSRPITSITSGSAVTATRWRDRDAWQRHVHAADHLGAPGRCKARTVRDVIDALASHMGPDGYGRPGSTTLATQLEVSRPTVEYALARLVDLGWLIRDVKAGGRNRRAVYLAATPQAPCEPTQDGCPQCRYTNPPEASRTATHNGSERSDPLHTTGRTPGVKNLNPTTPQGADQLVFGADLVAVDGGGGMPAGETQLHPATHAVIGALPAHLGQQLLEDPRLHVVYRDDGQPSPGIDAQIAAASQHLHERDIVDTLTSRLPDNGNVFDIAKLLLTHPRLGRLKAHARAEASTAAMGDLRMAEQARRLGDTNALQGTSRNDFIRAVLEHDFAEHPQAIDAGLAAYDATAAAIRAQEDMA